MVPATNPQSAYATIAYGARMPSATSSTATTTPTVSGVANCRFRFDTDALRHAMSGPIPVSASSKSPSGMLTVLKNGGPTVILWPVTHSDSTGKSVPHSTAKAMPQSTRLLYRNAASRLIVFSNSAFASRSRSRVVTR